MYRRNRERWECGQALSLEARLEGRQERLRENDS